MALKYTHVISFSIQVLNASFSALGLASRGFSTTILIQANLPPPSRQRACRRPGGQAAPLPSQEAGGRISGAATPAPAGVSSGHLGWQGLPPETQAGFW